MHLETPEVPSSSSAQDPAETQTIATAFVFEGTPVGMMLMFGDSTPLDEIQKVVDFINYELFGVSPVTC